MKSIPISYQHSIEQKIVPLLCQGHEKPMLIHHENTPYIVKFKRREKGRVWREWASAFFCTLLFQTRVQPSLLRTGCIQHEAERLRNLRAKHFRVPQVYVEQPDYIVMEYCGKSVAQQLKTNPNDPILYYAIVDDLIRLHQDGQWHGGAQVRNLTLKDGEIYRIDFEENTGNAMPLYLAQVYDVLLCFKSLSPFLKHNKPLGIQLMSRYLSQVNNPEIHALLVKVNRYLKTLRKILPLLNKKSQTSNDVLNMIYFSDLLQACLPSNQIKN